MTKEEEEILNKNKQLFNYKNNLKNTYINKISSLFNNEKNDNKEIKLEDQPQYN